MKKMSLGKKSIKGIKWVSISQLSKQVLQYLTTFFLVNLLDPSDFGLMAMAIIVINFLQIFKDLGTSAAIIQKQDASNELLSSLFYVNFSVGLLVTGFIYISAPLVADFYDKTEIINILRLLSITFVISSISIIHKTIIEKELNFNLTAKIEIISCVIASICAIILAFAGCGVWSLVFQALTNATVNTTLLIVFRRWHPQFLFKWKEIRKIFNFSANLIAYNILNFIARNADYLIVGKYLGDRALGHYYLGYRIMLYPLHNISYVIARVMFPVYSKIQEDNKKFVDSYLKVTKTIALVSFPIMIGIMAVSRPFVEVFFANSWNANLLVTLLLIFSPLGLIQSISSSTGLIFQAKGRTDWMFWWSFSVGIIFVSAFIIGVNWGVVGVAACYLFSYLLITYHAFTIPFKLIDLKLSVFIKNLLKVLSISLVMGAFVWILEGIFNEFLNDVWTLIVSIIIGILLYISMNFLFNKKDILYLKNIIKEGFA
ncbi:MAG: MOP flippase family protein [Ignavibacteria bacterium]|jgi:PST family polysaccharide transporter